VSRYILQEGAQATVVEAGFESLERFLKRLSALAELPYELAKKLWALWLGFGGVALAGQSEQAQAALGLLALAVLGGSRPRGFLSDAGRNAGERFTRQAEDTEQPFRVPYADRKRLGTYCFRNQI
jgi:hypothetical protein